MNKAGGTAIRRQQALPAAPLIAVLAVALVTVLAAQIAASARAAVPASAPASLLAGGARTVPIRVPHAGAYLARKAALTQTYARRLRSGAFNTAAAPASARSSAQSLIGPNAALGPQAFTVLFEGIFANGIPADGPTPPDSTGAIGPNSYIEFVNSTIAIYPRAGLASVPAASESEANFVGDSTSFPCDGQIRWDQQWKRWEYALLECNGKGSEALYFGWSEGENPAELATGWCKYKLETGAVLEDYPKLGGDDNYLIIGANSFNLSPEEYLGSKVFTIPKPAKSTPCPAQSSFITPGSGLNITQLAVPVITPVPANIFGSSQTGYILAADSEGSSNKLHLFQLTGSGENPSLSGPEDVTVAEYFMPPSVPQPNSGDGIDSLDERLTQAVATEDPQLHKMAIWTQHTVSPQEGAPSTADWYELQPGASTPVQEGRIQASGGNFVFNAAIAPNSHGDGAAIHYNVGGPSQLVQLRAASRIATTPPGTMTGELTLAESKAIDADFSCPSVTKEVAPCRWGDYAGASPDPNNPGVVWGSGQVNGPLGASHAAQWQTLNFALNTVTPPAAAFTITTASPTAASPVSFDASTSADPDGSITGYEWTFGDGSSGTEEKPVHTYAKAGKYTVKLTVTDSAHLTASVEHEVTVADAPPSASFNTTTTSPLAASPVQFSGSASDADGTIASYAWEFGDGMKGKGAAPSHTYLRAGEYTVKLTVTDDAGLTTTVEHDITVADAPPTATFAMITSSPAAEATVAFDGLASVDLDGWVASYSWDFGDGSTGSGAISTHIYAKAGTYTVKLTVTDDAGLKAHAEQHVTIAEPSGPLVGPEGKQGLTGPIGPVGPAGPEGKQGPEGKRGSLGTSGQIELVSCQTVVKKKKKIRSCTTKLVSGVVKFTATASARAKIARAGVVYATGSLRGGRLLLRSRHPLRTGRYTLTLSSRVGRAWITVRQQIRIA